MWLKEGLDLKMKPYKCTATGLDVGMIEVVSDSETKGHIQRMMGGRTGAFKEDVIAQFLQRHNASPAEYEKARDNFIRSCAGYSVASFVLGRYLDIVACSLFFFFFFFFFFSPLWT